MDAMFNDDGKEQFADKETEQSNVNDVGLDRSGQHFSPNVVQTLDNMFDGTKDKITTPPKIQELTTDEQRDEPIWPDSQNTIPDELLPSLNVYSTKSIIVHPSANCELQSPVQKLRIRRPSKFKESLYTSKFDSAADSHESSGHYPIFLVEIKKLIEIIPLCLQACDSYDKKGIDLQNHPRYKEKDSSDLFDMFFKDNLPQQSSGSLDCGLYIVTYVEYLSYGHKVLSIEFDFNALRTRYVALL
ncbi:hypothetical protein BC332_18869 [Capsicum chinense]|nr:hypothetical protein BC332_18869 [Capsicum chinense]